MQSGSGPEATATSGLLLPPKPSAATMEGCCGVQWTTLFFAATSQTRSVQHPQALPGTGQTGWDHRCWPHKFQ